MAYLPKESLSHTHSDSGALVPEKGGIRFRSELALLGVFGVAGISVGSTGLADRLFALAGLGDAEAGQQVVIIVVCVLLGVVAILTRRLSIMNSMLREATSVTRVSGERYSGNEAAAQRSDLETDLRAAIDLESLVLHYQPLFSATDQSLLGFEALLRWQHSERGSVSPSEFVPLAEAAGLMGQLGEWVLEKACKDAAQWPGGRKIAVNLSPSQLQDPQLSDRIAEVLARTGLAAERLELEITESALVHDTNTTLDTLHAIQALGARISLDDCGTGYSSLSYLQRFPFDKIKIDRSVVSRLECSGEDAAAVRAMLAMGRSMGVVAIAEGVESAEQFDYLLVEGCDEVQGFLLGRPMPFEYALALSSVPDPSAKSSDTVLGD